MLAPSSRLPCCWVRCLPQQVGVTVRNGGLLEPHVWVESIHTAIIVRKWQRACVCIAVGRRFQIRCLLENSREGVGGGGTAAASSERAFALLLDVQARAQQLVGGCGGPSA